MNRLMEKMVFSGLVTAWRLATWPTRRSPVLVNATTDGVSRLPSGLVMTTGSPPSMTATTELVVPKSMPMILLMGSLSNLSLGESKILRSSTQLWEAEVTEVTEVTDSQEERRNGDERSFWRPPTKGHEDTKFTKRAAAARFAAESGLPRCRGCRRAARADESHGPPFAFVPPFLL